MKLDFEIVFQDDAKMISRMTALGEGLLSGSLNCGFHCWLWHLKDKSWSMRISWNQHNRSTWKKCYTTAPAKEKTRSVKNPKHVFVFFKQIQKQNSLWKNSFTFDTFDLDGDNTAILSTCRLQYSTSYHPELDYEGVFKLQILNDLINFGYRKNE